MAKRNITTPKQSKVFRFMCMYPKCIGNYHLDFDTAEAALQYAEGLKDDKIEWYGIYELSAIRDTMKPIVSKRLIPYTECIPKFSNKHTNKSLVSLLLN